MITGIALTGFMGTGKSVVGIILAEQTGKQFIELDAVIEQQAGMSIPEIFRTEGEIMFREREITAVKSVAGRTNVVIACGGGVVLNMINIERLRKTCTIVCLTASPPVILERTLRQTGDRPLLEGGHEIERIKSLLAFRKPFYARAADVTVNTSRLSPPGVVKKIRGLLQI